jgi:hypothetical protein
MGIKRNSTGPIQMLVIYPLLHKFVDPSELVNITDKVQRSFADEVFW